MNFKKRTTSALLVALLFIFSCGGLEKKGESSDNTVALEEKTESVAKSKGDESGSKNKEAKTWKRSDKTLNEIKLFIGDSEEAQLKGTQYTIKIDGFRARVVVDAYFYNDRDIQAEGTFKMRLPAGASPYFFAFGESVFFR